MCPPLWYVASFVRNRLSLTVLPVFRVSILFAFAFSLSLQPQHPTSLSSTFSLGRSMTFRSDVVRLFVRLRPSLAQSTSFQPRLQFPPQSSALSHPDLHFHTSAPKPALPHPPVLPDAISHDPLYRRATGWSWRVYFSSTALVLQNHSRNRAHPLIRRSISSVTGCTKRVSFGPSLESSVPSIAFTSLVASSSIPA